MHGARGCPRAKDHAGPCYWWIAWEEPACWRVIVYSGEPGERRRRCRGSFIGKPEMRDVNRLLLTLAPVKRMEVARRRPRSEPEPAVRPLYTLVRGPDGFATIRSVERLPSVHVTG